ncbi:SMI1/KNR4 family protein [Fimbriiglobus ruber]|uniref:SMI1/KNR4 family protein n=1 Tax=Fimbriiglobus ruber TaxID=1908690 RepID=UPI0026B92176
MTTGVDWPSLFDLDASRPKPGLGDAALEEFVREIARPLNDEEFSYLSGRVRRNPFRPSDPRWKTYEPPDPLAWPWPQRRPPDTYLAFLRWSNGGEFYVGDRFMEFIPAEGVRNDMLAWLFPRFYPHILPFALIGRRYWYGFDLHGGNADDEPPVVFGAYRATKLSYVQIAASFRGCCSDPTSAIRLFEDCESSAVI